MTKDIIKLVRDAGVVGAGGAGFPTHIKLSSKVDTVIANGAECEPLLRVDQQLMSRYPTEVIQGLEHVMSSTSANKGIIALKKKYVQAENALKGAIKKAPGIKVHRLGNNYPAGDEQILVYDILKRIVPEGGLPLDTGVVVNNVGTLINIHNAVQGIPVTTRQLTITGAVKRPITIEAPIGTSYDALIDAAGGTTLDDHAVIAGGPMMGRVTFDTDEPITKTTSGLIVLSKDHFLISKKTSPLSRQVVQTKAACIQCSLCTQICPRNLIGHSIEPHMIMRSIAWGVTERPERFTGAFLCVECGLCTYYGCPMGLDPCRMNREIKERLIEAGVKNDHHRRDIKASHFREYRNVPVNRLIHRLSLTDYDKDAPMQDKVLKVSEVSIPLKQHIGVPSKPVVKAGQKVKAGELIGEIPKGSLGARVHASISGSVSEVSSVVKIIRRS